MWKHICLGSQPCINHCRTIFLRVAVVIWSMGTQNAIFADFAKFKSAISRRRGLLEKNGLHHVNQREKLS